MRDNRLYQRIPCAGEGSLIVGEERLLVSAVNLSKGGVCLRLALSQWERLGLDELDQVSGALTVDGDAFTFGARICWSNTENDMVYFGVQFKRHDKHIIDAVLERLSVVDEAPTGDSFNI